MNQIRRFLILGLIICHGAWADSPVIGLADWISKHLVKTHYTHETYISKDNGIYDVDCSAFAAYVLQQTKPAAYTELSASSKHPDRPLARDFFNFFKGISGDATWLQILHVSALKPGDLLAWLIPPTSTNASHDTGHVMIVRGEPTPNSENAGEWLVPVTDSAVSGHGTEDPRKSTGPNGVGSGVVGLIADATGKPMAFRWSGGQSEETKYTQIVMARVK